MNESDLVIESLRLMGIGMGIVFSFLMLLVGLLRVMSWLALKIAPAETPQMAVPAASLAPATQEADDLIAVISAAIARYRSRG
jgi:oxaloacetate decarboxylase gamma subunit